MYKLTNTSMILRLDDSAYIPSDEDNRDFKDYLAWIAQGNTPEPVDIPPVIIPTLTMRQARLTLLSAGLLDEVEAAITTQENRIWWDYSTTVERNHPLVIAVLTALGKTAAQIDEMFINGAGQL